MSRLREAEHDLLLLCLRETLSASDHARLQRLAQTPIDWTVVTAAARRNRITALVRDRLLQRCAGMAPAEALEALRLRVIKESFRNLRAVDALQAISAVLCREGIDFILLKGVGLSLHLYGAAAVRPSDDIDLLVAPENFWRADRAIQGLSYIADMGAPSAEEEEFYARWIKDVRYRNADKRMAVELHHRLTLNPRLLDLDFAQLWAERDTVRVGATPVAVLGFEHNALYLCVHGCSHGWERFRWSLDLAALLHSGRDLAPLYDRAARLGLSTLLRHALDHAGMTTGAAIAPAVGQNQVGSMRLHVLDLLLAHILAGSLWRARPRFMSWERFWRYSVLLTLYQFALKGGWRYMGRQLAGLFYAPGDWATLRLPARLQWLYPLLRPALWIRRWLFAR